MLIEGLKESKLGKVDLIEMIDHSFQFPILPFYLSFLIRLNHKVEKVQFTTKVERNVER